MSALGSILVLPGGGYSGHAPHEAEPVAAWLEGLGWAARVVRYPVGTPHPAPVEAVRAEIRAERAAGFTRVGVIGFSAGGHLAGHVSTDTGGDPRARPDFAILGYPVISMVDDPHIGSRDILVGDAVDPASVSVELLVDAASAPMFVWHTVEDDVVPVSHTYLLGTALARAGVAHELHTFPGEAHGVGLADELPAAAWTTLCAAWLARIAATEQTA